MSEAPQPQAQPQFDPDAPHQVRPKLRALRGFPLNAKGPDGKPIQLMGLADARQISPEIVATSPAAQQILPMLDGTRTVDEILTQVEGLPETFLKPFVAQLDKAGLIFGPNYEKIAAKMREEFDSTPILPPGASAQIADQMVAQTLGQNAPDEQTADLGPKKLTDAIDTWIAPGLKDATPPAFENLPKAVIAPHMDYQRGWNNYAHAYGRLTGLTPPDRVVVLGINHFGESTGVCGCDKGFSTPLGEFAPDTDLIEALRGKLGDGLYANRFAHEREHSVELQLPWIQRTLLADGGAAPKIFAALIHDPVVNQGASYDGNGSGLDPFIEALIESLDSLGGKTLVVGAVELAHAGRAFGDDVQLGGQDEAANTFREKIRQTDQELLEQVTSGAVDDLLGTLAWRQHPNRWTSTGALVAAIRVARGESVQMLNYADASDPQGVSLVTSAAMAIT